MLTEEEKLLIAILKDIGMDEDGTTGTLLMLDEDEDKKEENTDKLLRYIGTKGKNITAQDVLKKCTQICMPCEQYLPPNMFVEYISESTEELDKGCFYQVFVSYDNDRQFLIENKCGEQEVYSAEKFRIMDVSEVRYLGRDADDGTVEVTKGFVVGQVYPVTAFRHGKYIFENGLKCWMDEVKETGFRPAQPKQTIPFRHPDGALNCLRHAMEFGGIANLENSLAPLCKYVSQDAEVEFDNAQDIVARMKRVVRNQLEDNIFLDCAYATVTMSAPGNRFEVGERCLAIYMDGEFTALAFACEERGSITEIYILTEPYEFELD